MPAIPPPFSPPRKKMRLPQSPDFPFDGQFYVPTFSRNLLGPANYPYGYLPESTPAGMQGARHAYYGLPLADPHLNKLQSGRLLTGFPSFNHAVTQTRVSNGTTVQNPSTSENVSCLLPKENSTHYWNKPDDVKTPHLVLFGKRILTENQISTSSSRDRVFPVITLSSSSCGNADKLTNFFDDNRQESKANLETGHCKVFLESEDLGRTMNLSLLGSYDELYRKLTEMSGIIKSDEMVSHVIYQDTMGAVKHVGDEPFSVFTKTARRLTILVDSSSDRVGGRRK